MHSEIRRNGRPERSGIVIGMRASCLVHMFPMAWAVIGNRRPRTSIPGSTPRGSQILSGA